MGLSEWLGGIDRSEETSAPSTSTLSADLLFRRHGRDVMRFVRRMVGPNGAADVEDLTQQVFIAVHQNLDRFRGDCAVTTWLYGIASRTVLMHFRTGRRRNRAIEAFGNETRTQETAAASAESSFEVRQELERVSRCLEQIKPKKRIVFVLHEVEGLSGKEIAHALDINEATVWTRLFHARRELVALLRKEREP
jgi:RNA polymerase sigma-70 factor (ECF subfamily)